VVIVEQFKSLNLNQKKMRNICTDEVGVKMKKTEKKRVLQFQNNVFSLLLFSGCSFGFAFPR